MTVTATLSDICKYWTPNHPAGVCSECSCCWKCGREKKGNAQGGLERCHIIPKMLGGSDTPDNLVILCRSCHDNAPDVDDPNEMWQYIDEGDLESFKFWDALVVGVSGLSTVAQEFFFAYPETSKSILAALYARIGIDNGGGRHGISWPTRSWVLRTFLSQLETSAQHSKRHEGVCLLCKVDHRLPTSSRFFQAPEVFS